MCLSVNGGERFKRRLCQRLKCIKLKVTSFVFNEVPEKAERLDARSPSPLPPSAPSYGGGYFQLGFHGEQSFGQDGSHLLLLLTGMLVSPR